MTRYMHAAPIALAFLLIAGIALGLVGCAPGTIEWPKGLPIVDSDIFKTGTGSGSGDNAAQ